MFTVIFEERRTWWCVCVRTREFQKNDTVTDPEVQKKIEDHSDNNLPIYQLTNLINLHKKYQKRLQDNRMRTKEKKMKIFGEVNRLFS